MLQKQSKLTRCDNSRWNLLKLFQLYKHGYRKRGRVSFFILGAIRKRKYISPNKKRHQVARKAFACILVTRARSHWPDGQYVRAKHNKGAAFTQRIRRSRLKVQTAIFFTAKRRKYVQLASALV